MLSPLTALINNFVQRYAVPTAFVLLLAFVPMVTAEAILDAPLALLALCYGLVLWRSPQQRALLLRYKFAVILVLVIWGAFMLSSAFFAVDKSRSFGLALTWIRHPAAIAALTLWLWPNLSAKQRWWVFSVFFAVFTLLVFDGFLQYLRGHDLFGMPIYGGFRLTGPFSEPILGFVILHFTPIIVALYLAQAKQAHNRRALDGLLIALFIGALIVTILSGEKMFAAWAACYALCYGLILLWPLFRAKPLLMLLGLSIVVGVLGGYLVHKSQAWHYVFVTGGQKFLQILHAYSAGEMTPEGAYYANLHFNALNIFQDNWLTGIGMRGFSDYCTQIQGLPKSTPIGCSSHPHQSWLNILLAGGIIAGLAGLWLTVIFYGHMLKQALTRPFSRTVALSYASVLLVASPMLLSPLQSEGFFVNFTEAFLFGGIAITWACAREINARRA